MSRKKWQVSACDKEDAARIAQEYGVDPLCALLASSRGLSSDEDIRGFFFSGEAELSDPFLLKDMDKAVERVNEAVDSFERIAVFGDYDADGITSAALICSYLGMREANFFYFLPTRDEGYGLSVEAVDRLHSMGASLIITVDNGTNSIDEINYAASLGIDTVVTDHHRVGSELPSARAVVNPHRHDCGSGFKNMAGVGVVFKLVCALEGGDSAAVLDEYADLAAIGTIGDIVPLTGENRKIVRAGIERINSSPRVGISALLKAAGHSGKPVNSSAVSFMIAPRLNAAGRMGSAERALMLLMCDDEKDAALLADEMESANTERQRTEQSIFALADEQIKASPSRLYDKVIICDGEGWHIGVIGIVASRLTEKYGRPCIVISRAGEIAKGSGRSIEGFSLFDMLESLSDCLSRFGGHTHAAGLTIESARIDEFREAVRQYTLKTDMPFPTRHIDIKLNPKSIGLNILDAIEQFEPFGAGNPQPVFGLFKVTIENILPLSGGKHLRITAVKNGARVSVVRFGVSPENFPFCRGAVVDLAVTFGANDFNGVTKVGVYLKGIRYSGLSSEGFLSGIRCYSDFMRGEFPSERGFSSVPARDFIGGIYRSLKKKTYASIDELCVDTGNTGLEVCSVMLSVDALCELGLAERAPSGRLSLTGSKNKVSLEDSKTLKRAGELSRRAAVKQ